MSHYNYDRSSAKTAAEPRALASVANVALELVNRASSAVHNHDEKEALQNLEKAAFKIHEIMMALRKM